MRAQLEHIEWIDNKKRNRLGLTRAEKLVRSFSNLNLLSRNAMYESGFVEWDIVMIIDEEDEEEPARQHCAAVRVAPQAHCQGRLALRLPSLHLQYQRPARTQVLSLAQVLTLAQVLLLSLQAVLAAAAEVGVKDLSYPRAAGAGERTDPVISVWLNSSFQGH
jgi:hypothetical protein